VTTTTERPKLTPQERARRKKRRAWIPTAIIGGLIVIAVVIALAIQNSGTGKTVVEKPGDTVFSTAGMTAMSKDADAQIEVRGPRQASAIDLPANCSTKFGPYPGISTELDLVGTGGGIQSLFVDSFRVTAKNDYLTTISTTTKEFGFTAIHDQLQAESVVGISAKQFAAFQNAMPAGAGGPDSHFTLAVGTGRALGVPTKVSVSCDGAKGCTVSTVTTLQQK
jgi:hypothetical protein